MILIAVAFIMLAGIVFSFSLALAEDQQMVTQKMDKDKTEDCMVFSILQKINRWYCR